MDRQTVRAHEADDDLVTVLASARRLIDRAISNCGDQSVSSTSSGSVRSGAVAELVANAQRDLKVVVSSSLFLDELTDMLKDVNFSDIGKHVTVTAVCDMTTAGSTVLQDLVRANGLDVRVTQRDLPDIVIIDGKRAFTRLSAAKSDSLFIWNSEMVKLLNAFYAEAWRSSLDHNVYAKLTRIYQCGHTRKIIDLLARGHKDEVAARSMNMSVRTYRRYIAELMRDLGAQSRFQIGVRLAQVGGLTGTGREWN